MKNYKEILAKLKKQTLEPNYALWLRIEDTLQKRRSRTQQYRLAFSLAAAACCAVLVFTSHNYYDHYQLDQYLSQVFTYTPNPAIGEYGTFI
ncbi:hypothetical protein RDn1_203 [Candidatus Termititenax dinenymphae]|uniref:Uncharacterized protein n=1 Tax=Candidatus Termititenax dinenymphae TaxID=2218523 RepID=A0A388TLI8_9BACT|nr:hypothetical protein RDn1_203 [Candidatus Termititenax dinenymphae]